tara:strand:+ start:2518 stop:3705 length:1188 start_codon:yes stop_codon:yes gene_type:complete
MYGTDCGAHALSLLLVYLFMLAFAVNEVDSDMADMKIVHVETGRHFYGGAQQVIWLIQGLAERDVDSVLVCSAGTEIDSVAQRAGLRVVNIPCNGDLDLAFPIRLNRFLRCEQPDIVHCHSRRGGDLLGGWASLLSHKPAVVSRRVDSAEKSLIALLRYMPFQKIVAISEHIAAVLRDSRVDPKKLSVIRSAVDVNTVKKSAERRQLEEFGIRHNTFAIAVAAQLIKRKGHRFILNALPQVLTLHPEVRVVFFGRGPERARLIALARKLGVDNAVQFVGFRSDIDDYLAAFDLFVHSADKEGLGVSILKASAAQLPVIAFDVAGCREAIVHMETGLLVPLYNQGKLCSAIGKLIEEPELRGAMGVAGRRRMLENFSVSKMVEGHIDIYSELVHGQ